MYQNTPKRQCTLCLKPLYAQASLYHVLYHPQICISCLQQFDILNSYGTVSHYSVRILYTYNDFFKQLIYQYKGLYDYALKDVFLDSFQEELKRRYRNYLVVVVPSSVGDNEKRGFVPNEEIVKTFAKHIFIGLYKDKEYKQTSQVDRTKVKKVMAIREGEMLRGKKILLFDDVITSGSTIQACIDLVKKYQPKAIEVLVLATNQHSTVFNK